MSLKSPSRRFASAKAVRRNRSRLGFSLIEALIAVAITLIMMLALSKGFALMSENISDGRARLTLSDQLRGVSLLIREDMQNMTAGANPMAGTSRTGYFEYYEGPVSDSTAAMVSYDASLPTVEEKIRSSRFGDFDDIVSFTARAKKGQWFYGEVPYPLVAGQLELLANPTSSRTFTADEWARSVTVASDTAEIIYFMMPWSADPTLFTDLTTGVVTFPMTGNNPNIIDNDAYPGVPDGMMLCRRVLLVLPTLNLPVGTQIQGGAITVEPQLYHEFSSSLPSTATFPNPQMLADALGAPTSPNVDAYRFGLRNAYQRCDLSVRRVPDGDMTTVDPIAANSLSDLEDPRNRFGHTVLPVIGTGNTTMPLWSLTNPIPMQQVALVADGAFPGTRFTGSVSGATNFEAGFLLPHFMRQKRVDSFQTTGTPTPIFQVAFSEVLANNCIGFDLRAFDENAPQLFHPGADGGWGAGGTNLYDVTNMGAGGTDDAIVNPIDPGFAESIEILSNTTAAVPAEAFVARRGAFVDIGWANKAFVNATYENNVWIPTSPLKYTWAAPASPKWLIPQLHSPFSGTSPYTPAAGQFPVSNSMYKSGRALLATSNNRLAVYQPGFDTFTDRFESDGYYQTSISADNGGFVGTIWINGQSAYLKSGPPPVYQANSDLGTNGIDDFDRSVTPNVLNGGIDDQSELETSPPVTSPMKAVQVLIRVEDKTAGNIQQIAVSNELRL